VEADLQRYYGLDFRDLWRPTAELTWRRLRVLLDGLPAESLWWTALRQLPRAKVQPAGDIDGIRWGTVHDLLAALIDATNQVQWTLEQVNSTKRVPAPKPFPRPGTARKRRGMSKQTRQRINNWLTGRGEQRGD
jgi:hypothetical protein